MFPGGVLLHKMQYSNEMTDTVKFNEFSRVAKLRFLLDIKDSRRSKRNQHYRKDACFDDPLSNVIEIKFEVLEISRAATHYRETRSASNAKKATMIVTGENVAQILDL